jgi:hypothetical protein
MASVAHRVWSETLTVLALAFLVAFSYPAFVDPVPASTQTLLLANQLQHHMLNVC